jgi:nicotinamidase-related amidase
VFAIDPAGQIWDRIKGVAEANECVPHMIQTLKAARSAGLRIFYALHHRYRPGDYETWKYIAPIQRAGLKSKVFEDGTWGGEVRSELAPQPGDVVAQEHWCSSGFANTDLDLQLKKHGIHQLIVIGLIAHTCVEATVRYAAELGYDVTMVKDATADYSDVEMRAALDVNLPNYAGAIVTLYGTIFAATAANSRVFSDMFRLLGFFKSDDYASRVLYRRRFVWFLTLAPVVLFLLVQSPVKMVVAGGVAQALMLPVVSIGTLYLRHRCLPQEIAPPLWITICLWLATLVIVALMTWYALLTLGYV